MSLNETTPLARAAYITRILLLRRWRDAPGMTTLQVSQSLSMTRSGASRLLNCLSEREELPVYQTKAGFWHARYEPRGLSPPEIEYTSRQRASVVTQRLICRYLFEGEDGLTVRQIAALVGHSLSAATKLMMSISESGGVPVYTDNHVWKMEMMHFDHLLE